MKCLDQRLWVPVARMVRTNGEDGGEDGGGEGGGVEDGGNDGGSGDDGGMRTTAVLAATPDTGGDGWGRW